MPSSGATAPTTSLVESLLDPSRPTFLFGCTPPSNKTGSAKVHEICRKFVERGRVLALDGFIVYDVQDESSRTSEKRPFPFRKLYDSSWYAGVLTSESNKSCIVYKAAPCSNDFDGWLKDCVEKDGHTALTIVGAPTSRVAHPGPSTKEACKRTAKLPGIHFGCVCIAERHITNRCEHEILIKKMEWGAEWFITQGIYDPQPMIAVIKDYSRRCKELKLKPKKIVLTFTPCGRRKTMSFIKWLGMRVPEDVERRIFASENQNESLAQDQKSSKGQEQGQEPNTASNGTLAAADLRATTSPRAKKARKKLKVKTPVQVSCDIMCENLRKILDETNTCGVPLGINVESVSGYRDEIDATHDLFRSLQSIMLNHQGLPWAVHWHTLDISERRRQLALPRSSVGGSSRGDRQGSDGTKMLLHGFVMGALAVGLGFYLGSRRG